MTTSNSEHININKDLSTKLDNIISKSLDCHQLSSLSMSIVQGDQVIYKKAFGYANIPLNIINRIDETFLVIASISKTFTAILISYLFNSYEIPIEKPLNSILKSYNLSEIKLMSDFHTKNASMLDLLAHRMAVDRFDFYFLSKKMNPDQLLQQLKYFPTQPNKTLGKEMSYSNLMYVAAEKLLEKLIQKATNNSTYNTFTKIIEKEIFQVLDMKTAKIAQNKNDFDEIMYNDIMEVITTTKSAIGVLLKLDDIEKFQLFLTHNDAKLSRLREALDQTLIGRVTVDKKMMEFLKDLDKEILPDLIITENYGMGWFIGSYKNLKIYFHGGSMVGTESILTYVPQLNISIFIHVNTNITNIIKRQMTFVLTIYSLDLLLNHSKSNHALSNNRLSLNNICHVIKNNEFNLKINKTRSQVFFAFNPKKYEKYIGNYTNQAFGNIEMSNIYTKLGTVNLVVSYGELLNGILIKYKSECYIASSLKTATDYSSVHGFNMLVIKPLNVYYPLTYQLCDVVFREWTVDGRNIIELIVLMSYDGFVKFRKNLAACVHTEKSSVLYFVVLLASAWWHIKCNI